MKLTENTKVRVKVPKHLYEAIQAELDKKHGMDEGHYGDKEMEEGDDYMEEGDEMNEYVGMSPDQVQAMELAGQILAAVAAGTGLTAGIVNLAKKVKSKIQSKSDKPEVTAEELEEVLDLNTLMEAVKDASKKKVEDKKKKELEAKKKKAEDEKKKKEAEAKKKVADAKKK